MSTIQAKVPDALLPTHIPLRPVQVNGRFTTPMIEGHINLRPGHCIGAWPGNELSGTVMYDYSGNNFHGDNQGMEQGSTGFDGNPVLKYDGLSDSGNIGRTGLLNRFNSDEGTFIVPAQSNTLAGSALGFIICFNYSNSDFIRIIKISASTLQFARRVGGVTKNVQRASTTTANWIYLAMSWSVSANQLIAYYNGSQTGTTQTGITTQTLIPPLGLIGTQSQPASVVWDGFIGPTFIYDVALTAAEIAAGFALSGIS